MALELWIDSTDLSAYVQAAEDEFNPANAFQEPQFANNSLTDGDLYISMTTRNREWSVPLLMITASNDALATLVRTINKAIEQGSTVKYREDGATNYTYFDLETGTLEAVYKYQRNRQGVGIFRLKMWTRPLGHTGTTVTVASALGTQFVVFPVASFGRVGDAYAPLSVVAQAASGSFGLVSLVAWGYHPNSNFTPLLTPNSAAGPYVESYDGLYAADTTALVPTVIVATSAVSNSGGTHIVSALAFTNDGASTALIAAGRNDYRLFASIRSRLLPSMAGTENTFNPSSYVGVAKAHIKILATYGVDQSYELDSEALIRSATAYGTTASKSGYYTYDLGAVNIGGLGSAAPYHVAITGTIMATNAATHTGLYPFSLESLTLMPMDGGMFLPANASSSGGGQLNTAGWNTPDNLAWFDANAQLVSQRGLFPEIPATPTGVVVVAWGQTNGYGPSGPFQHKAAVSVGLRDTFRYLR